MFSLLQHFKLNPILVDQPASTEELKALGKNVYVVGKTRVDWDPKKSVSGESLPSILPDHQRKMYTVEYLSRADILVVCGGLSTFSILREAQTRNLNNPEKEIKVYTEDDYLILIGEKRYYLENDKTGTFAYCFQTLDPDPSSSKSVLQRGKIGSIGETVEQAKTNTIKDLIQELQLEGYLQKEIPKKWHLLYKFYQLNKKAYQYKKKLTRVKINYLPDFQSLEKDGIRFGHLVSHNTNTEYIESLETLIIQHPKSLNQYVRSLAAPKAIEGFKNLRQLEFKNLDIHQFDFDSSQLKNLRILKYQLDSYRYHRERPLDKIPLSVLNSKSLLDIELGFQPNPTQQEQLNQLMKNNALYASYHKNSKDRKLAISKLSQFLKNPFDENLDKGTIFISSGKIKNRKETDLAKLLEGLGFVYQSDYTAPVKGKVIAILGAKPKADFIELLIQNNPTIALESMLQEFLQEAEKQLELKEKGSPQNEKLKENLGELLNANDEKTVEMAMQIASSKEIQKETTNFDELSNDWLSLAMFSDKASIRNKSKRFLKNNAPYEFINFVENVWNTRWRKNIHKTLQALRDATKITDHPKLDKPKFISALVKQFSTKSGSIEPSITEFLVAKKWIKFIPEEVVKSIHHFTITPKHIEQEVALARLKYIKYVRFELNVKQIHELQLNFPDLDVFRVAYLSFKTIPKFLYQSKKLNIFYFASAELASLPKEVGNWKTVQKVRLDHNELTHLVEEVGNWTQLESINLENNRLSSLPESIKNWKQISTISLYDNHLSQLPSAALQNWTSLDYLNLNKNQLGSLASEIQYCKKLEALYLENNQLESIPTEIGKLCKLTSLNLRKNLIKKLPKELGQLDQLGSLQLDYSHRDKGTDNEILKYLGGLTQLGYLSLSHIRDSSLYTHLKNLPLTVLALYESICDEQLIELLMNLKHLRTIIGMKKHQDFIEQELKKRNYDYLFNFE